MPVKLNGSTSGYAQLQAAAVASNNTLTLPSGNGMLVGQSTTVAPTNGQIPIGNGTDYTPATITAGTGITVTNGAGTITISSGGTIPSGYFYTTTGANTYTKPAGLKAIYVRVLSGGGSGGAVAANNGFSYKGTSTAGGTGAYAEAIIDASLLGATTTMTVGAGGAAVTTASPGSASAVTNGNAGGTSSVGSLLSCSGGAGGLASASTAATGTTAGVSGGTVTATGITAFVSLAGTSSSSASWNSCTQLVASALSYPPGPPWTTPTASLPPYNASQTGLIKGCSGAGGVNNGGTGTATSFAGQNGYIYVMEIF